MGGDTPRLPDVTSLALQYMLTTIRMVKSTLSEYCIVLYFAAMLLSMNFKSLTSHNAHMIASSIIKSPDLPAPPSSYHP